MMLFWLFTLFMSWDSVAGQIQNPDMALDNKPIVFTLFEGTTSITVFSQRQLECVNTVGNYKISLISIDPTTNCVNCFNVWSDNTAVPSYFLRYVPGAQRLDYDVENTYTITVECEDSEGNTSPPQEVEVRVTPNEKPFFPPQAFQPISLDAANLDAGASIYAVTASDSEGDELEYQLETTPTSSNFAIRRNGEIFTVNGLQGICTGQSVYEFSVRVKDPYHEFTDPLTVDANINYPPQPSIGNANKEVVVAENVVTNIHVFNGVSGTIAIDSVQPTIMRDKVTLFGGNILRVDEVFNFEEFPQANVSLTVTSGTCTAKYWLKVIVQERNDLPILTPNSISAFVPEGVISYNPSFAVTDEDFGDGIVYTIERAISNTRDLTNDFQIDTEGVITSNYDFDLDARGAETETILFTVRATDKRGGFDESEVQLVVENINDNAPVITNSAIKITDIMDCDPVQEIATINAVDEDTGSNGQFIFKGTSSSGILSINADGSVFLTSQVTAGTIYTLNVLAEDLGNPPRTSAKAVTVTVIGQPCTTLPPVTTIAVTVANDDDTNNNNNNNNNNNGNNNNNNNNAATTQVPVVTAATTTSLLDDPTNLIWIILLGLLGLLLLGLLAWCLWRYCFPRCCPNACGGSDPNALGRNTGKNGFCQRCCGRSQPPVRQVTPEAYGDGGVKDFWQEHYQEKDYGDTTHRTRAPTHGYHEDGYLNPR